MHFAFNTFYRMPLVTLVILDELFFKKNGIPSVTVQTMQNVYHQKKKNDKKLMQQHSLLKSIKSQTEESPVN